MFLKKSIQTALFLSNWISKFFFFDFSFRKSSFPRCPAGFLSLYWSLNFPFSISDIPQNREISLCLPFFFIKKISLSFQKLKKCVFFSGNEMSSSFVIQREGKQSPPISHSKWPHHLFIASFAPRRVQESPF